MKTKLILLLILLMAGFFRSVGLNWDANNHLHPDERFLTMVALELKWPHSFKEYLNPAISPLNPYNTQYGFFVYGVWPVVVVKAAAEAIVIDKFDYNNVTLVGRLVSVWFELGVLWLVYLIAKLLFDRKTALWAAFFYALAVLPIQLAHFFAVDTFLVFFLVLSFYRLLFWLKTQKKTVILQAGVAMGLALGCKISAAMFLPFLSLGFVYFLLKQRSMRSVLVPAVLFGLSVYITLRLVDPRVFATANWFNLSLNPKFVANINNLKVMSSPAGLFPPSVQWLSTKPIIYPLRNMVLWGWGAPMGILVLSGFFYGWRDLVVKVKKYRRLKNKEYGLGLILILVLVIFVYQGIQFTKAMRYFYPLYPFLAVLAANFTVCLLVRVRLSGKKHYLLFAAICLLMAIYPLSFISIYIKPHSRIQASEWIYQNITEGSTLSCEHWDDCLPLGLGKKNSQAYNYKSEMLELFHEDNVTKWQKLKRQFKKIDYLIMSSNRLWGSIPKVPDKYPRTAMFYQDLFGEKTEFTKATEITSYPCFPPIGKPLFCFNDSGADENFTVFDHPKVLIYRKKTIL